MLMSINAQGQQTKPVINSLSHDKWASVGDASISDNGMYMSYVVNNEPLHQCTLVIKQCEGKWEKKVTPCGLGIFTGDSKSIVLLKPGDSLVILKLGGHHETTIPDVTEFKLNASKDASWIAYRNRRNEVVLLNIKSGLHKSYLGVEEFQFSEDKKKLILKVEYNATEKGEMIDLVNLADIKETIIWKGNGLKEVNYNATCSRILLLISNKSDNWNSIWCYNEKRGLFMVIAEGDNRIGNTAEIFSLFPIGDENRYFSFNTRRKEETSFKRVKSTMNLWSYLDERLKELPVKHNDIFSMDINLLDIEDSTIVKVNGERERIIGEDYNNDVLLLERRSGDGDVCEEGWNDSARIYYVLKFMKKGNEVTLGYLKDIVLPVMSRTGRYVVFFNRKLKGYISYEIATRQYHYITEGVKTNWADYCWEDFNAAPRGVAAWQDDDDFVLLYDKFDIWRVDLKGLNHPVNITNGFGSKNDIVFYLGLRSRGRYVVSENESLILNALNLSDKKNGYFRKRISELGDPVLLTMGDYIYQLINNKYTVNKGIYPIRATGCEKYLVTRMKANESPNYYYTSDFKKFRQLSNVYPEQNYNWYTTELHTWTRGDGSVGQGVLYKPENFDPNKKYPIIFQYYEKLSYSLNEYILPEIITSGCEINIPTFVSNGYLVFTPDIDYEIGFPMRGALEAVTSAANYMSHFSFIDKSRMGIGGCSLGGIETNYIVTHSNLFAAAYSASSLSDLVSAYGSIPDNQSANTQGLLEFGVMRIGESLAKNPSKYIENSAIFSVKNVTTPLLLMHTTNDGLCSFSQAVEFFISLRRLRKKVWLLEYTDGSHGVQGESAVDLSIRIRQFFDHYLKGLPAPIWMTQSRKEQLKRDSNGFEVDSTSLLAQ
ncbi:hypothetical protein UNH65_22825 [Chitinophaga sp. 180180018-2]|nr:hypothetical protein [Chitinophaga sp. 212800010-3]